MSNWAPRPRRDMGVHGGLFEYNTDETIVVKSQNPMQQQRQADGTPYTRGAKSALKPMGPKLVFNDFEEVKKSVKTPEQRVAEFEKAYKTACDVVKSFLGE